jgi:hypothetical protein
MPFAPHFRNKKRRAWLLRELGAEFLIIGIITSPCKFQSSISKRAV